MLSASTLTLHLAIGFFQLLDAIWAEAYVQIVSRSLVPAHEQLAP